MKVSKGKNLLNVCSISLFALTLAACGGSSDSDSSERVDDVDESTSTLVDATDYSEWVGLDLSTGELATDGNWQVALRRYAVQANGGSSGDGDVTVCLAHTYDDMYDESGAAVQAVFESYSADNTLADFAAVNSTYCLEEDYQTDTLETQISQDDWLDSTTYSASSETSNGWLVRSSTSDNYARVKVSEYNYDSVNHTLDIVLQSELWNGTDFDAAMDSPALSAASTGKTYWDLETNTVVTESDDWDLSVTVSDRDTVIQVNGGASGSGDAAVAYVYALDDSGNPVADATVWDVDNIASYTEGGDVYSWYQDGSSSAFDNPGTYGAFEYNIAGGHKMWPNYATYIVNDGEAYYKLQLLGYYGEDGTAASGTLLVRHAVTE
ncbi:hypothetical protein EOL70_00445 [Leucothrix sargassi]|nr:hypothetical protein EOL70_00445 [Leucothrix sargassi]